MGRRRYDFTPTKEQTLQIGYEALVHSMRQIIAATRSAVAAEDAAIDANRLAHSALEHVGEPIEPKAPKSRRRTKEPAAALETIVKGAA